MPIPSDVTTLPQPLPRRIDTARLVLRPPVPDDAEAIFAAYCQDPEVCRYMMWVPHASVEVTRQFIDWCIRAWSGNAVFPYMLARHGDAQAIGMVDARVTEHRLSVGYVLARAHWGQGYMPEAVRALGDIALAQPTLFRMEATCDVDNLASARTLEKSGLVLEGRLARYTVHPNLSPEPRDCWLYAKAR